MSLALLALLACEPVSTETGDSDTGSVDTNPAVDTGTPFDQIVPSTLDAGPNPCRPAQRVTVGRVIDGDTFEISGGSLDREHIRIIGLNTPEIGYNGDPDECWAQEAKAYATKVLGNRDVWLTFDAQCLDNYGRYLAYVHTGTLEQGNYTVRGLSTGQGFALSIAPNTTFEREFRDLALDAANSGVGLWGTCR